MGRMEKNVKNGIMFQGFEWYLPSGGYFADMEKKIPDLVAAGINSVWLPPQCKATGVFDVGYGIYDLYDLGEFDQKGEQRIIIATLSCKRPITNSFVVTSNPMPKAAVRWRLLDEGNVVLRRCGRSLGPLQSTSLKLRMPVRKNSSYAVGDPKCQRKHCSSDTSCISGGSQVKHRKRR